MTTDTEQKNTDAHWRSYALFSAHDPAMFEVFADDIVEHQEPPIVGREALAEFNRAFWAGFSDLRATLDRVFAAGDFTFAAGRVTGTNDGPMPAFGIDRTGRKLDVGFVEVIQWRDGKAAHSWPIMDQAEVARQLGISEGAA
jgi:predicted ester cyclase